MKKNLIKTSIFFVFLITIIYLSGTLFFDDRYIPNTYINGECISNKKESEIEKNLINKMKNYSLTIVAKDVPQEVIYGDEIEYKGEISNNFYEIIKNQNKYLWFLGFFNKRNEQIDITYTYDKNLLKERLKRLNCVKNENAIEPQNAYIKRDKSGFRVINETEGTIVDFDKLYEKANFYIENSKTGLNLEKEDLYKKAEIDRNSEELKKEMELYNEYSNFVITYDFSDREEIIDFKIYGDWIDFDENKNILIDEDKIKEYVKELAKKYDTLGNTISFNSTNSGNIDVETVTYGWKIDIQSTVTQLKELIENKETITIEPIYTKKAISRNEDIIGNTYVEISLSEQRLWFYKDGQCLVDTPVVTGLPTESRITKKGVYYLVSREKDRYLGTYEVQGYRSYVNYWMPFNGGQGIHDATWRSDSEFGGDTYKTNGSHGCVNTPLDQVKIIYENIKTGYPIIVY